MTTNSFFTLQKKEVAGDARAGILSLPHGDVPTPVFMPVGTQATVKGILPRDLHQVIKCSIILGNTYHLNLRPGVDIVRQAGGLSEFMNWNGPVLTDSGGFQVFSLSKLRKTDDQGVRFRSHLDGKEIFLGPGEAMDIQNGLHSDIAMCLDECPPAEATPEEVQSATDRTTLWAEHCLQHWQEKGCDLDGRKLFGIVQGGRFEDLRLKSAKELIAMNFPGYAIGGVSVGETEEEMLEQVKWVSAVLPEEKPRYVMGVGTPPQLLSMVGMGVDMFDCVMPTRSGRTGLAFTWDGKLNLKNSKFQKDKTPLIENCDIKDLNKYSKSYLNHLIKSDEMLGSMLISLNNIYFYQQFMREIRYSIKKGTFKNFYKKYINFFD